MEAIIILKHLRNLSLAVQLKLCKVSSLWRHIEKCNVQLQLKQMPEC